MLRIEGLRNWGIEELGNLGIWEFGNLGIWEFGNLGIWEFLRRKVEIVMVWQIQSLNSSILNC